MNMKQQLILSLVAVSWAIPLAAQAGGTVVVIKSGNKITISGDGAPNQIALTTNSNNLVISPSFNTLIQGPTVFSAFTGDVDLSLGAGDDLVTIQSQDLVLNNVTAHMGTGAQDVFTLRHVRLTGSLSVTSQSTGSSSVTAQYVSIRGGVTINTGTGSDSVNVEAPTTNNVIGIGGSVSIDTRDGHDQVRVGHFATNVPLAHIGGNLSIRTGAGRDLLELIIRSNAMAINLGEGDDSLNATNCSAPVAISVDGGLGYDTFANRRGNSSRFIQALTSFENRVNQ